MPKHRKKIKAKEMFEGDPQFISIVNRGANGAPVRIMKSEDDTMQLPQRLTLHNLFGTVRKSDGPTVIGVVAPAGVDIEKAREIMKSVDIEFDAYAEQDGCVVFLYV